MKPFTYERAGSVEAAARAVAAQPAAKFIAGGTNLLDLMKIQVETPLHLVDVKVAFHNGAPSQYREVSLPQLQDLLDEVISDGSNGTPNHHDLVRHDPRPAG